MRWAILHSVGDSLDVRREGAATTTHKVQETIFRIVKMLFENVAGSSS